MELELTDTARRDDAGKLRLSLLPPDGVEALARHYGVGAEKYGAFNWEGGMAHLRLYDSLQRHALAWRKGEDVDAETGSLHMIAAAWNALTLAVYQMRGVGADDRRPAPQEGAQPYAVSDTLLTLLDHRGDVRGVGVCVCAEKEGAWLRVRAPYGGETVVFEKWRFLRRLLP